MKAPEKIKIGKYNITSDGDVIFAWVTNEPDCEAIQHDIEYIRADAFIKMAFDAYCKVCKMPNCSSNECKMIDNFKEFLKEQ